VSDQVALLTVVLLFILLIILTVMQKKSPYVLRELPAFQRLRRAIGLAVEDGKRIHIALGRSSILSETFASGLIGLGVLKRLSRIALISDHPPLATSGEGSLMILGQDGIKAAYRRLGLPPEELSQKAPLVGATPLSYGVGSQMAIRDERVAVDLIVCHVGSEAALICDASHQQGNLSIAGSDDLTAQAIAVATATYPLLGEEVFGAVAYMDGEPIHQASLQTQDIARWVIILIILIASAAKLIGL